MHAHNPHYKDVCTVMRSSRGGGGGHVFVADIRFHRH